MLEWNGLVWCAVLYIPVVHLPVSFYREKTHSLASQTDNDRYCLFEWY